MTSKALIVGIISLLVLVGVVIIFMQVGNNTETGSKSAQENSQMPTKQGESTAEEILPEASSPITEFSIEADDRGFYIGGSDVASISASSGKKLKLTFNVRSTGVYYGGLDFRGCGFKTERVSPGSSTTVEFSPTSTCTITSYWPSSGVVKDNLQVIIR